MLIKRIINNNVIASADDKGREIIVTGRGIGFKRKPGEEIPDESVEKIYRMEDKEGQSKLTELVSSIPLKHIQITDKLIEMFKSSLDSKLNDMILITLSDHISFAIQRKEQGLEFKNPMFREIMEFYPKEFQLGCRALDVIEKELGVRLAGDEAAFIALHIINSEMGTNISLAYKITELINGAVTIAEEYYGRKFDIESDAFNRFVVHLRFLARRIFSGRLTEDSSDTEDTQFRKIIEKSCRHHFMCAQRIAEYIEKNYNAKINNNETVFLTIHLKRIDLAANSQA